MTTQKAVIITEPKKIGLVTDRPIPALQDDYILVRTVSVGLNPTVEAIGKDIKKPFKKGNCVCGFTHGANAVQPEDGAFAEYIVAKGDLQIKIPDNMSFQDAATLGVSINTLALPTEPMKKAAPILIYGGSTVTGTLAIQFAKISRYTVLITCSPHNFNLIRNQTKNNLKLALDYISLEASAKFCNKAIFSEGGEYSTLLDMKIEYTNVNNCFTLAYTTAGEAFNFGDIQFLAKLEDQAYSKKFIMIAESLLPEGKVKVHPPMVGKGGLKDVIEELQLLKEDKVSKEKLVYNIAKTLNI
ncbi:zinc-binding alcohol dehydrogenase family protein [Aspergillus alliaceus]|uniref:zinc-binding alcohol dehydrogenase family protein n=1 Tax=Petromyces alliaceus TaxID=209559 RepID=UPI0012A6E45F|nr:chaperonin 10-like protein [Aspergillus alliaceus]KAB8227694.1 chaperonin 10-like protein [Aspergillus alliaceus]